MPFRDGQSEDFCGTLYNGNKHGRAHCSVSIMMAAAQPTIIFYRLFLSLCHFSACLPHVSAFQMSGMALQSYTTR